MDTVDESAPIFRNSAKALILRGRSVLLQEQRFDGRSVHLLPGGTQQFGESLGEAVCREVWEETGVRVRVEELLWVREFIGRNHPPGDGPSQTFYLGDHVVECIFRCAAEPGPDSEPGGGSLPDRAQIGVRWVPLDELPTLTMWPVTVQRLLIAMDQAGVGLVPGYLGDCP